MKNYLEYMKNALPEMKGKAINECVMYWKEQI